MQDTQFQIKIKGETFEVLSINKTSYFEDDMLICLFKLPNGKEVKHSMKTDLQRLVHCMEYGDKQWEAKYFAAENVICDYLEKNYPMATIPKPIESKPELKHTPGPWDWAYDEDIDQYVIDSGVNSVCIIDSPLDFSEQDAKLIAAAPEMLEELKSLYRLLLTIEKDLSSDTYRVLHLINKAEGRI